MPITNPLVRAVSSLRKLNPEQFRLAVTLAKPDLKADNGRRKKKPGPKPGSKRVARATTKQAPQTSKRIEPEE